MLVDLSEEDIAIIFAWRTEYNINIHPDKETKEAEWLVKRLNGITNCEGLTEFKNKIKVGVRVVRRDMLKGRPTGGSTVWIVQPQDLWYFQTLTEEEYNHHQFTIS